MYIKCNSRKSILSDIEENGTNNHTSTDPINDSDHGNNDEVKKRFTFSSDYSAGDVDGIQVGQDMDFYHTNGQILFHLTDHFLCKRECS